MPGAVLVTGASGYFGRVIVDVIRRETDWNVIAPPRAEFDLAKSLDAHDFQVDYIIHAAANRYGTLPECLDDNVLGTYHLLEFAKRQKNLKNFVYVSSNDIFGPGAEPRDEEAPMNPTTVYAATKAVSEKMCLASGLPVTACRFVNVRCPEPDPRKFPQVCRRMIEAGEKMTIYDGRRLYIDAGDAVAAILFIIRKGVTGKFNITGKEMSNLQVAQDAAKELGRDLEYELLTGGPGHESDYNLSGQKLKNLGWPKPGYSILITTWECYGVGSQFIKENLEKITKLTYRPLQCVISDHSKNDEIENVVKSIDPNGVDVVYVRYTENYGNPAANWNNALEHATGDLIQYFTMDDWFHDPSAVSRIVDFFEQNQECDWCMVPKNDSPAGTIFVPSWPGSNPMRNTIGGPNSIIFRSKLRHVKMDPRLKWWVDTEWYHRLFLETGMPPRLYTGDPIYTCRTHPRQLQHEVPESIKQGELRLITSLYS